MRLLDTKEIECKVSTISDKGCQLLLYKTARTDMDLLDETYGSENWECEYTEIKGNLYCGIRVYFGERSAIKWDCGIESEFGDKEKAEASDAFKRAGFKWGIGRELYTTPFIWVQAKDINLVQKGNKYTTYDKFSVEEIDYNSNREIVKLKIKNDKNNKIVYIYDAKKYDAKKYDAKKYYCQECQKEFKPFTSKDGRSFTAGQVYHMAEKANTDGKARCKSCRLKREGNQC